MNLMATVGSVVADRVRETAAPRPATAAALRLKQYVRAEIEIVEETRYERWQTQDDERTCPVCGRLNGMTWPAGEGFKPPIHDHCRCERVTSHVEYRRRIR